MVRNQLLQYVENLLFQTCATCIARYEIAIHGRGPSSSPPLVIIATVEVAHKARIFFLFRYDGLMYSTCHRMKYAGACVAYDRERYLMTIVVLCPFMLAEGKEIPSDLRHGALALSRASEWDDEAGEYMTSHEDDEYRWAGVEDPKIVITTSRDPSSRLKMFAKVRALFPKCPALPLTRVILTLMCARESDRLLL